VAFLALLLLLSAWGAHNITDSGRLSIMTSWDGENIFRGNSDAGLSIYPYVSLDAIFSGSAIVNKEGIVVVAAKHYPRAHDFGSEWEWSDYYKALAKDWVVSNPEDEVRYVAKKIYNYYLSIEKSPCSISPDARGCDLLTFERVVTSAWLFIGRVVQILFVLLLWVSFRIPGVMRTISGVSILASISYSAPFIIGFNYERHITVHIVLISVCVVTMSSLLIDHLDDERGCCDQR
jgi:hypothetical protein